MDPVLFGVGLYVIAQLAIGLAVSRRMQTEEDYLLAGRRLGYSLATFSIFATWFGAETCIGAAGAIYDSGLSGGRAEPFGYGLCLLLMGLVFAGPLWRRRYTTIADLYRERYSPPVERVAALIMVPGSILWAAAQIRAFGQVLSASSSLELGLTITIAAVVVVVYTTFGGLRAAATTDAVQGAVLIVGLVVVGVVVALDAGPDALSIAKIAPERFRIHDPSRSVLDTVETWAIPICGSVMAQELVQRVLASRSEHVARRATLTATGLYVAVGLIPAALGLFGPTLLPGLDDPERLLPELARAHLPLALYILFAGALVSAILSTVDSTLLVASSLVSHNVIVSIRPDLDDAKRLAFARAGVVVAGIAAYVIALHAGGIFELVESASAFGSGGLFAIFLLGLFTKVGHAPSAMGALIMGVVVFLAGKHILLVSAPFLASLGASLAVYLILAPFGTPRDLTAPATVKL